MTLGLYLKQACRKGWIWETGGFQNIFYIFPPFYDEFTKPARSDYVIMLKCFVTDNRHCCTISYVWYDNNQQEKCCVKQADC